MDLRILSVLAALAIAATAGAQSINVTGSVSDSVTSAPFSVTVTQQGSQGSQGFLPPNRTYAWKPGVTYNGGIPNRTTVCANVPLSGGDSTAAIQAAINACPVGQVVQLAAGTYNLSSYVYVLNGITLRGAGAGKTILSKTNGSQAEPGQGTGPNPTPLVILGWLGIWNGNPDSTTNPNNVNLTVDAVQGATSVTVANGAAFQVGQIVLLDENSGAGWQPDRTGMATSVWASPDYQVVYKKHNPANCFSQYACADDFASGVFPTSPGQTSYSRSDRVTNEIKEIASISGNTITFNSPISIPYRVSHAAQLSYYTNSTGNAYWPHTRQAGLEGVSLIHGDDGGLSFNWCAYCWAKNVENSTWAGQGFRFVGSFRSELREFYSHSASYPRPGSGAYAIALDWGSSEILIEDGISITANKVMVARAGGTGSVVGYNYMDMGEIDYNPSWIEIGLNASHYIGPHHVLFEGNYGHNADSDNTHGNSVYMTYFRNALRGIRHSFQTYNPYATPPGIITQNDATDPTPAGPKRTAGGQSYSSWFSFVGNVLGAQGQMTGWSYETTFGGPPGIWFLGWDTLTDPGVKQTVIRDGNWDWLNSAQKWENTPGGFNVPNSMYLTAKPAFFGTNPWPWVDPTTGITYTLPAKARYDAGTPNG